ncbi:NADH-ubiquinone oxidoreductase 78 kDa subunit mitochondrial [Colletotrichum asianum]
MQDAGSGGKAGDAPSNAAGEASNPLEEEEYIPSLRANAQAMAIFVPLEESLFEPSEAPKTNGERLEKTIDKLDKHFAAVQENIMFVYERERRRIIQVAKKMEAMNGPVETDTSLTPHDQEVLQAYIEAPLPPGANYAAYHSRTQTTYTAPVAPPENLPARQGAIQWSLYNAGQELVQIYGYHEHAENILAGYRAALKKEVDAGTTKDGIYKYLVVIMICNDRRRHDAAALSSTFGLADWQAGRQCLANFCNHSSQECRSRADNRKLAIAGNCRMCLVEVEKAPKPIASCAWPVQPGMVVKTNSPITHKAREGVMEFLLANHPLDCPICDQGGECDLQDQSMRYGADRGRFHEMGGKRAVEDKNIGPLIKTSMNRCIHCTRCVRFSNDIAGAPEMGSFGRGNDIQIGTYLEQNLDSELSGNVIDLCPVGALTSKPYAFRARPWELKHSESIDVLDGLGSNIRVDSRGLEVMRILPRLNDDVNEEWINDKTRFACDGLKTQRLTMPLIRRDGKFEPADWEAALMEVANAYHHIQPKGNEFKVIAGELTEVESLVAMKDLANKLGSENLALDMPNGSKPIAHGVDVRSNYLFNSRIYGIEEADAILIVGSNPRHEAAVLNARIRKQWLRSDLEIGVVGETWDSTFEFEHLGTDHASLKSALAGPFGKKLQAAKRPMIIVGSGVTDHEDAKAFYETVGAFVDKNAANFLTEEWNGYNVLQRAASRAGAFEVGFTTPSAEVAETAPKFVWLLGADEISEKDIPKNAFVVYQGHHGDRGAQIADVVLPGAAYTEKAGTYINTEGRVQMTRAATSLPGAARTDWKIIRAISEFFGAPLPYDDVAQLRDRMVEVSPALAAYDVVEPVALQQLSKVQLVDQNKGTKASRSPLRKVIDNFYFTDVISRSSPTMARCSAAKATGNPKTNFMAPGMEEDRPMGQVAYGA